MNKRIEALLEQALDQAVPETWTTLNLEQVGKITEKFAELIVRECANIILNNDIEKQEDYGVNHPYFGGWERGVIDSCQIIKKHFGVE